MSMILNDLKQLQNLTQPDSDAKEPLKINVPPPVDKESAENTKPASNRLTTEQANVNLKELIKITDISSIDELKTRWLRHILGEPRFKVTYTVLGGQLLITLRTRLTSETDLIMKQLQYEVRQGLIDPLKTDNIMVSSYLGRYNRLNLAICLESLRINNDVKTFPTYIDFAESKKAANIQLPLFETLLVPFYEHIVHDLPASVVTLCLDALQSFEAMQNILLEMSCNADFWKAAAG